MKLLTKLTITALYITLLSTLIATVSLAQAPKIDQLIVQIWPEYDRPETLVIYQGRLADDVPLPATLTFEVPTASGDMHAVAVMSDEGRLVNADYTLSAIDDTTARLTITVENPRFQFEYYDPNLVVKEGTKRVVSFSGVTEHPVNNLQVEFQQPPEAQDVVFTPESDEVMSGNNNSGFQYHIYRFQNLESGEYLSLSGSYIRNSDTLSADLQVDIVQPDVETSVAPPAQAASTGNNLPITIGYVLVGIGVGVLLVVAGIWLFNNYRTEPEPVEYVHPGKKRGSPPAPKPVVPKKLASDTPVAKFCSQCGERYKPEAKFCHQCGTPRR